MSVNSQRIFRENKFFRKPVLGNIREVIAAMQTNTYRVEARFTLNRGENKFCSIIQNRWVVKNAQDFSGKRLATFHLLALGDVVKNSYKVILFSAINRDRKPYGQRFDFDFKFLRQTSHRHPAVNLEQLRMCFFNPGNCLCDILTNYIIQSGQPSECGVDIEVDKIRWTAVAIIEHLAVCESFQHVFKQRVIALFVFL